ncbi:MAG: enoyl-CoA hydratase/isomerase family protein [Dehalococcoidia bacterium]|nr:enoyl-CoA hydratase/isomerase family protein [Dehalococcoidia bacterium]
MAYEDLLLEKKDHIALVTLNQPQKLNALSRAMAQSLDRLSDDLARDDDTRVVVVTGAGRGFCSGADVSMMAVRPVGGGTTTASPSRFDAIQAIGYPHADAFPKLNKPVIAAINGPCVGGGLSLALSCDIRIAADVARFGAAQVSRGLVPDYGMTMYLPLIAGVSNAFRLMFTAEIIGAAEAKEMGIVSHVVPLDKLMNTAMELAGKIAKQPPFSLELTKKMVWRSLLENLSRQLDLETWAQRICFGTEDHQASVRAFLNKEPPPQFKGR